MKTPTYFAHIERQEDGSFLVRFPDVPGALSEGTTVDEAVANAREALTGVLGALHDAGEAVPRPAIEAGPNRFPIQPDPDTAVPVMLRWAREDAGLTQAQLADRMGITQQAYQKLERTGGNPSIKTLAKVARALGLHFAVSIEAPIAS